MAFKGNYKYFTNYTANAYTKGRGGNTIDRIVIHHWGADGQRFIDVCNFFQSRNCQTSANYVACAGMVACLVSCWDTAYHAGNWNVNQRSIGIECRPECSEADIDTVAQLVAELWQAYPTISRTLRVHKEYYATACPGRWEARLRDIERRATDYLNGKQTPAVKPALVFKTLKVGELATISSHATHLKNGTPVSGDWKNKTGKIIEVIDVQQSASKKAYLLDGFKDYLLEQDVEQARGKNPPTISMIPIPEKTTPPVVNNSNNNNSNNSSVLETLDRVERLTFGNGRIQRDGRFISVLEEISEIRNSVEEIKKSFSRIFK